MKILKTGIGEVDKKVVDEAIKVLSDGGVVLYPTDTVYGLGANIFNNPAVRRVFEIKQRSFLKPLSILVCDKRAINLVSKVSPHQMDVIDNYLPGSYTLILKKKRIVPRVITSGSTYVGVRVPANQLACRMASLFPITTTSANISDKEVLNTPQEILEQIDCDVDLVIDAGPLDGGKASVIVDLSENEPKIIRR